MYPRSGSSPAISEAMTRGLVAISVAKFFFEQSKLKDLDFFKYRRREESRRS